MCGPHTCTYVVCSGLVQFSRRTLATTRTADSHESTGESHAGHEATVAGETLASTISGGSSCDAKRTAAAASAGSTSTRLQVRLALALSSTPRKTADTPAMW